MKRKWPEIISSIPIKDSLYGFNVDKAWRSYLEENLSKEELDRIAPPIEEPIQLTKEKYFQCLRDELIQEGLDYYGVSGVTNIPPQEVLNRVGGRLWGRLSK